MAAIRETKASLNEDLQATCTDLLTECDEMPKLARDFAKKENDYRLAKATAYLKSEGTVDARKSQVDLICEKERVASHIAEGLLDASRERIRSLRSVLSALQTIANSHRVEQDFERTGPRF